MWFITRHRHARTTSTMLSCKKTLPLSFENKSLSTNLKNWFEKRTYIVSVSSTVRSKCADLCGVAGFSNWSGSLIFGLFTARPTTFASCGRLCSIFLSDVLERRLTHYKEINKTIYENKLSLEQETIPFFADASLGLRGVLENAQEKRECLQKNRW